MSLLAESVVNAAGLESVPLAKRIRGLDTKFIPNRYLAKGCYFALSGVASPPFSRLVYPLPEDGGLGVHVTVDLGGQVKFGPDVEWLREDLVSQNVLNAA